MPRVRGARAECEQAEGAVREGEPLAPQPLGERSALSRAALEGVGEGLTLWRTEEVTQEGERSLTRPCPHERDEGAWLK